MRVFARQRDFETFEEVSAQAKERLPMRILAWCLMHSQYKDSRPLYASSIPA